MLAVGPRECQSLGRQRPASRDRAEMGHTGNPFKGPSPDKRKGVPPKVHALSGTEMAILGLAPSCTPSPDQTPHVAPASCRHASVLTTVRHVNSPRAPQGGHSGCPYRDRCRGKA